MAADADLDAPADAAGPGAASAADRSDTLARDRFLLLLRSALERRTLRRLVLSAPRSAGDVVRLAVRPVALRGGEQLSVIASEATRDVTSNRSAADVLALVEAQLGPAFAHAHLHATDVEAELRRSRRGRWALVRHAGPAAREAPAPVASAAPHDRAKRRWVDIRRPWLAALGVTDADARLLPTMARKWKQINKFVEVFDQAWREAAPVLDRPVRVMDFGAGKGYLTFAIHDHLTRTLGLRAEVTGVELRPDLVALCEGAARAGAMAGLRFVQGDVRSHPPETLDVMIALHACDTATDHALHAGVRAGALLILSAPCCHRELRPQMVLPAALRPLLQHGVHLGQEAEMVTDGLRALLLEAEGYATQVFEFVALEHTRKNKMILAQRRRRPLDRSAIEAQIRTVKSFYGIRSQSLETLLAGESTKRRSTPA